MTESDDTSTIRDIVAALLKRLQARSRSPSISDITTRIELQLQVNGLKRALDAAVSLHAVPVELCHTLRAPAGTSHIVELAVGDQLVRAVINPLGQVDPERELAVWRDLLDTATICVYPGEQLRRMQPAILAVRLSAEILVVNTEHPRAIVRAAMKLLQPGALVPLPVAWILDRARTRPGRTSAAVAGVAVALTLTLINYPASPVSRDRPVVAAVPSAAPSSAPITDTPADAPTDDDSSPTPPHTVFQSAPPPTGAPRNDPTPDQTPDQDDPDPRPTERSERQEKEDEENPDDREAPDRPAPTPRPSMSAPPPGEDAAPTPRSPSPSDRPASPSSGPSTPASAPTSAPPSNPPPSNPRCHLLDVDVDLPILNVDVCV